MALYPEDDTEERIYPIFYLAKDILDVLQKRFDNEGISFKDHTIDQLAKKLNARISKLPSLLRDEYDIVKLNLLDVVTDCYCIISQMEHKKKYDSSS